MKGHILPRWYLRHWGHKDQPNQRRPTKIYVRASDGTGQRRSIANVGTRPDEWSQSQEEFFGAIDRRTGGPRANGRDSSWTEMLKGVERTQSRQSFALDPQTRLNVTYFLVNLLARDSNRQHRAWENIGLPPEVEREFARNADGMVPVSSLAMRLIYGGFWTVSASGAVVFSLAITLL